MAQPRPHMRWLGADDRLLHLAPQAIGYLVPRGDFAARVHSAFEHACNLECGAMLLTLVAPRAGDGPTMLRLGADAPPDLRRVFKVGQPLQARDGVVRGERAAIDLVGARIWRPVPRRVSAAASSLRARLHSATSWLRDQRTERSSVLDGAAMPVVAALMDACRALDGAHAAQLASRLVGWGEGLTPAGDDFLVGLCAGFDALLADDPSRTACRAALATALRASLPRTTRISAHHLRLAADGHHSARVLDARDALLSDVPWADLEAALHAAGAIGATSGADMLTGLLAALGAWSPTIGH